MYKIFSRIWCRLQLPGIPAACDPLARMTLGDLADLPSRQGFEVRVRPQSGLPCSDHGG
jgi:hypothetical protein